MYHFWRRPRYCIARKYRYSYLQGKNGRYADRGPVSVNYRICAKHIGRSYGDCGKTTGLITKQAYTLRPYSFRAFIQRSSWHLSIADDRDGNNRFTSDEKIRSIKSLSQLST